MTNVIHPPFQISYKSVCLLAIVFRLENRIGMSRRFFLVLSWSRRFLASARVAASASSTPDTKPLSGRERAAMLPGRSENQRSILADEDN